MSNCKCDKSILKATMLQLADTVLDADNHELGRMTVSQIKDGNITFFRPYTHTSNFSYTGGVICYVGIEESTHRVDDNRNNYHLVSREEVK